LQRRLAVEDVKIENLSGDYMMLSIQGPRAQPLIAEMTSMKGVSSKDLSHLPVTIADITVILITVTHGAELGYDLVVPVSELRSVIEQTERVGKQWSLSWIGVEAQDILRIEAGIPLFNTDITEKTLLWESGQERWISFNRQLAGLILESKQVVQPAAKIYDGACEIGSITSCRFSPRLDAPVALAYLRKDYLTPSKRVMVRENGKSIPATVSVLPME
jgi:glycine cleavage system aminomethyltransferase T